VLSASGHRGRLAADDPEDSEQSDYANSDGEKIKVFSIHKPGAHCSTAGESLKSRI
jgi:hypothetical protein